MTELQKILEGGYTKHEIGNYNSELMDTYGNGVKCGEDIDNWTLVEVVYDADGKETCVSLTDVEHEGMLICTPEVMHLPQEKFDSFYNGVGEKARVAYLPANKRFQTTAFAKDDDTKDIVKGNHAHFDPATKKFIVSNGATDNADFANAFNKFVVQEPEVDDLFYGREVIMLRSVAK